MQSAPLPSVTEVFEQVLASLENNQVTDQQISSLAFLFDKHLPKALQIVDQGGVFRFVGERSGRSVYEVQGQSSERYVVCPAHFCSCHAFFFDVISKADAHYCKHQLAARLADALGKTRTATVSDLVVAERLAQL